MSNLKRRAPQDNLPRTLAGPVAQANNATLGIMLMIMTTVVFALQDTISRHLAETYNTYMVVMVRYWFFAAFVVFLAMRRSGGIRAAARTAQPGLQVLRGVLLAAEVCIAVYGFTLLGLIESHAVFICYPLLVAALSGPVLGERVGWRRWAAIGAGFVGVMVILQPGRGVFQPAAIIPLISALIFALYGLLTRFAARRDSAATSFFWTGTVGAVFMTAIGIWFWQPMTSPDWVWMGILSISGVLGHWLLIKCYAVAEASTVQPFAYFHLVWAAILGMLIFGETIRANVGLGAAIIVGAGLFALWRERAQG